MTHQAHCPTVNSPLAGPEACTCPPATPQLDRVIEVSGISNRIGDFLMEHLAGQGIVPARWVWEQLPCHEAWGHDRDGTLVRLSWLSFRPNAPIDVWDCPCGTEMTVQLGRIPNPFPHARWTLVQIPLTDGWLREQLAGFFGVDPDVIEQERTALLDHIRRLNAERSAP